MRRYLLAALALLPLHLACDDEGSDALSCQEGEINDEGQHCCNVPPLTEEDCPEGWVFERFNARAAECVHPDGSDEGWIFRQHTESGALDGLRDNRTDPESYFTCGDGVEWGENVDTSQE